MNDKGPNTYSFQTDLIIDAVTRDLAEARLKQLLQSAGISTYKIGRSSLVGASFPEEDIPSGMRKAGSGSTEAAQPSSGSGSSGVTSTLLHHMEQKTLVRLSINKGKGVRMSIPGRILNIENELITVYHVDEKQVYTFLLQEIDDFS
ncbi:hypothetical protein [Paenibacillus sp. P22]|uniref:hypothetical protein n=1 Tax=Paenibacillus TaxID=44249 RepID=UPI0003901003|nr:hypothetical protein [Paenibacillus sp. P22]CDN45723.1 Putative uncharacterized protein [Paenibacillus sp. P22]